MIDMAQAGRYRVAGCRMPDAQGGGIRGRRMHPVPAKRQTDTREILVRRVPGHEVWNGFLQRRL